MVKILIVDDEPVVRRGIVLGIDWAGIGCLVAGEAANGEEGIAAALRYSPNLIITDVRMPKMDGIEMITELRQQGWRGHVIILTAHSDFDYARSALQLGVNDYLLKPFRNQELINAVQQVQRKEQEKATLTPQDVLPLIKGDKSRYVLQALNYIAEHYSDSDLSITPIARSLDVSEGHLSHMFKKETSYTIINYLTQYRMHIAMQLFREGGYKVYEVAERVGYRDVTYFSSLFKKHVGVSPSDYQNRCV